MLEIVNFESWMANIEYVYRLFLYLNIDENQFFENTLLVPDLYMDMDTDNISGYEY